MLKDASSQLTTWNLDTVAKCFFMSVAKTCSMTIPRRAILSVLSSSYHHHTHIFMKMCHKIDLGINWEILISCEILSYAGPRVTCAEFSKNALELTQCTNKYTQKIPSWSHTTCAKFAILISQGDLKKTEGARTVTKSVYLWIIFTEWHHFIDNHFNSCEILSNIVNHLWTDASCAYGDNIMYTIDAKTHRQRLSYGEGAHLYEVKLWHLQKAEGGSQVVILKWRPTVIKWKVIACKYRVGGNEFKRVWGGLSFHCILFTNLGATTKYRNIQYQDELLTEAQSSRIE